MEKIYIEEKHFEQTDFSLEPLPGRDYEDCVFNNCNFSNTNLTSVNFTGCKFNGCNMTMANLTKTAFRDCTFKDCKLLGLHFNHCHEFGLSVAFENCILNLASFYKSKLKNTKFTNSSLHETDFAEANLSGAVFANCDLAGASFDNTNLEKADLRTAYNYTINPETNRIKKAKFSVAGIAGLLTKYDIVVSE